ncbi:MAG: hypothetical protein LQ343_006264 [Gyalolechia ehrenbergii]|nr:MAG: hypothetical protein LQ343_006264 [Gyalolechia ehrenbergii]
MSSHKSTTASSHDTHKFAANRLLAISFSDANAYQSIGDPTPLDYKHEERLRIALAYIYKVNGRLNKSYYSRFSKALDAHGKTAQLEQTRKEISEVFELANEYELWEEFLDCFMPHWQYKRGEKEQEMMRLAKWKGQRRGAIS